MAKGNDGNYLQHSLEIAAAVQLRCLDSKGELFAALCHGMAPFEECDQPRPGQARGLLLTALKDSYGTPTSNESPLVTAYRATSATLRRYPNSAELLRTIIGTDRLYGAITEIEADKYTKLSAAWLGSHVCVCNCSWRGELRAGGQLDYPRRLKMPWLLTLDPMTYRAEGEADDNNLYQADLPRLSIALRRLANTGVPGAAFVFVFAIRPEVRPVFWQFADQLARHASITMTPLWVTHQGGNRNLAALFSSRFAFANKYIPDGVTVGF